MPTPILVAKGNSDLLLLPSMLNRHGVIAGATGTGKTISLQTVVENLSRNGIPTFLADIKGDLSGLAHPGEPSPRIQERLTRLQLSAFQPEGCPVVFWDVFGKQGHPIRATVSDMGPLMLGRLLNLNDTQSSVLSVVFQIADDSGMLLLDLKDLQAMLKHVGDHAAEYTASYGNLSKASLGAIQRGLVELGTQKGHLLFGEPALNVQDLMQSDGGRGVVNILAADELMQTPKTYATFLLWLLSELFEEFPEAGDLEKPRMVFFFDEAHLLFEDAPKILLEKIEQVVRLIRSKGVGIFFITQNSTDIPDKILGQLGNRIQHALRAFTPKDQKNLKGIAQTFRTPAGMNLEKTITELEVGEALVSFLDDKGSPAEVQRALVCPPVSRIGILTPDERQAIIQKSVLYGHYEKSVDRESAYEILAARVQPAITPSTPTLPPPSQPRSTASPRPVEGMAGKIMTSAARAAASQVGRQIATQLIRGLLGSFMGGRRR